MAPAEQLKELLVYETHINDCYYKYDSTHALLKQRIAAMYFYQADYLNAARYMKLAIDIINTNAGKSSINIRHNIRNYYSLAWIYDSLNNITGKMKALDSCAFIGIRLKSSDFYCVSSLNDIVEYCYDMGDYHRCIEYAIINERVAREYSANSNNKVERLAGLQFALRSLFLKVNAMFMLHDYKNADKLLINSIGECKKNNLKGYLGTIYQQLAKIELERGNEKEALLNYGLAFRYEKEAGDNIACKAILNLIGHDVYFERFHDINKELVYCQKALEYINKDKHENVIDAFVSLNTLTNIGNVYARKGFYDSAFTYFQRAFNQIKPGMNELFLLQSSGDAFSKNKSIHYLTKLLITKGDTYVQLFKSSKNQDNLLEAIQIYKITDRLLTRIKSEQKELESKLFWRSDSHTLYENAIEACFLQNNPGAAFYFFEKSRAMLLNDQLTEQQGLQQNDIMKQTQLMKKQAHLKKESDTINTSSEKYTSLQTEIVMNKQEQEHLISIIKDRIPVYYQNFLDTNFISVEDVRKKILKDHQVLLELFIGDNAVYSLIITSRQMFLYNISKPDFDSTVKKYTYFLSDPGRLNIYFNNFVQTATHLNNLIFQNSQLPAGRIIISPDGQYFPFEALVTGDNSQEIKYFLNDHAVSYTYSARFLLNDFAANSSDKPKNFLGIAPVSYPSVFSLASLAGSGNSLDNISGHFDKAVNLVSTNATRNNFQQQFFQYKIIQLYTHASDSSRNNEPVIYFSDSALYLSELMGENKILTKLIVLSACKTGLGRDYKGEGVFSFNRGFATIGIPSSVANLWTIDNESTYKLTELFYKYIAKGLPLDEALQQGKLEFIKTADRKNKLPYYWAAPILVGKTDAIILERPFKWQYLFAGIGVAALVFFGWKKLGKRVTYPNSGYSSN